MPLYPNLNVKRNLSMPLFHIQANKDLPFFLGNRPRYGVDSAGIVGLAGEVAAEDRADESER